MTSLCQHIIAEKESWRNSESALPIKRQMHLLICMESAVEDITVRRNGGALDLYALFRSAQRQ